MKLPAPHFLLFSETQHDDDETQDAGQWRFVLESVDGASKLEAEESEPNVRGERLDLLAVVRGLEALDQPSRVTLVTGSRYVSRGLRHGLDDWRESNWQWERFGKMAEVKNSDLWQRVDRAMQFHQVECRTWRFDPAERGADDETQTMQEQRSEPESHEKHQLRPSRGFRRALQRIGQTATARIPK